MRRIIVGDLFHIVVPNGHDYLQHELHSGPETDINQHRSSSHQQLKPSPNRSLRQKVNATVEVKPQKRTDR